MSHKMATHRAKLLSRFFGEVNDHILKMVHISDSLKWWSNLRSPSEAEKYFLAR